MKNKLLLALLFSLFLFPFLSHASDCDLEYELITENRIQENIDEFYAIYLHQFNTTHEKRHLIKPFLRETMERTAIDFTNSNNDILLGVECGRSINLNINEGQADATELYIISILDLDGGHFEFLIRENSLDISIDYFGSNSYLVVASKVLLNGFDFIQNDNFSIIVADLDPINSGGGANNNPPNAGGPTVFPNPFSGRMQINSGLDGFENFSEIQIQAIDGRVVRLMPISPWSITNPSIELDGSDLQPGLYILRLIGYDDQVVFKILKE